MIREQWTLDSEDLVRQLLCFNRSRIVLCCRALIILVALVCATICLGQDAKTDNSADSGPLRHVKCNHDDVQAAVDILRNMFPDIAFDSRALIRDNMDWGYAYCVSTNFAVLICDPPTDSTVPPDAHQKQQYCPHSLEAEFLFGGLGRTSVPTYIGVWRSVVDAKEEQVRQFLRAHRTDSNDELLARMKGLGMKYGPSQNKELIEVLPLRKLEPLLGGKLQIGSVQFISRDFANIDLDDLTQNPEPVWRVEITSHLQGSKVGTYVLMVDAFDGRLRNLHWERRN